MNTQKHIEKTCYCLQEVLVKEFNSCIEDENIILFNSMISRNDLLLKIAGEGNIVENLIWLIAYIFRNPVEIDLRYQYQYHDDRKYRTYLKCHLNPNNINQHNYVSEYLEVTSRANGTRFVSGWMPLARCLSIIPTNCSSNNINCFLFSECTDWDYTQNTKTFYFKDRNRLKNLINYVVEILSKSVFSSLVNNVDLDSIIDRAIKGVPNGIKTIIVTEKDLLCKKYFIEFLDNNQLIINNNDYLDWSFNQFLGYSRRNFYNDKNNSRYSCLICDCFGKEPFYLFSSNSNEKLLSFDFSNFFEPSNIDVSISKDTWRKVMEACGGIPFDIDNGNYNGPIDCHHCPSRDCLINDYQASINNPAFIRPLTTQNHRLLNNITNTIELIRAQYDRKILSYDKSKQWLYEGLEAMKEENPEKFELFRYHVMTGLDYIKEQEG